VEHVIAVLGLGAVCMLWYVIQRLSGREGVEADATARRAISCGHCKGCDDPATHDSQDCPE